MNHTDMAEVYLFKVDHVFEIKGNNEKKRVLTASYKLSRNRMAVALVAENENLILRFEEEKTTVVRILPWFRNPRYAIKIMTFNPTGSWLICVCKNSILFIVPALGLMKGFPSQSDHALWSTSDLTEIVDTEITGVPTCVAWWHSMDDKHLAIVGCKNSEIIFIDLILKRKVIGFQLGTAAIISLDIVRNFSKTASYLLIHTTDCSVRMMLELTERPFDLISLKSILHLDKLQYHALLSEMKYTRSGTVITLQEGKGRYFLVSHNCNTNQVQIYDPEIDKQPLFEYKIFSGATHLCWNDRLMFAVTSEAWDRKLHILSSQLAEDTNRNTNFSHNSIIQSIQIPFEDIILMFIKEETLCSSNPETFRSETITLPICVIVTSHGIYECRQRLLAEDIFLELIYSAAYKDHEKAENFGLALHLDIDRLYHVAAAEKLRSKCYMQCQKLLKRSRADPVSVMRTFFRYDRVSDSVLYLKQIAANMQYRSSEIAIKISNTTIFCYVMQMLIQAANGKSGHALRESFSQFLKRNEYFSTDFALRKLILTGLTGFLFEVAKARGEITSVLGSIIKHGHMHINTAVQDFLFTNQLIADVWKICNGALLRSMAMGSFIKFLLSEEELFPRYFEYLRFLLTTLEPATLTFLAQQLDPLSTSSKYFQNELPSIRNYAQQCSRNDVHSIPKTSYHSKSIVVELFVRILMVLSHKKSTSVLWSRLQIT